MTKKFWGGGVGWCVWGGEKIKWVGGGGGGGEVIGGKPVPVPLFPSHISHGPSCEIDPGLSR